MSFLRIVLAISAILAIGFCVWAFASAIPSLMQVLPDMEVSDLPRGGLVVFGLSDIVSRCSVAVVIIGAGLGAALVWMARSDRVSDQLSISASTAVGALALISVIAGLWPCFRFMVAVIERAQG